MGRTLKARELREMGNDQLRELLREDQQALIRLRVQAESERLDAPSELKRIRREIARILTILRERQALGQA
jgi:large subunit ribosomal protein L29